MKRIELLSPAKNLEVGIAAIDAGADAVYIGGPAFGARKAAGNTVEDIAELCRYAHLFGAKVLVTLNTLLRDDKEMEEAVRLAYAYSNIGVDALILQDLRLAKILFDSGQFCVPNTKNPLPFLGKGYGEAGEKGSNCYLHASTQCDNRTVERVQELEAMGFRRVVLARELSLAEMRTIREQTHCELEAFVHGALCVSYSGACYLSEAVCGRSANRGECAQMCRLPYDVLDENKQEILHQKHILSLRDLDRSRYLREMIEAGITTFKIEGRLKDIDYVRNITAYYRMLIDELAAEGICEATSLGLCKRTFTPNPEKTFHRGETAYFTTECPEQLVNMDTPKSTGEYLGHWPINPALLHNGDGLTYAGEGFYWPNNRIRIPAGTPVYRNYDAEFQRQLTSKDACTRVLPVNLLFEETETGFALSINEIRVTLDTEKVPAQNVERAEAVVRQQLSKMGGSRLEAAAISIRWSQPYFLPASLLNELRRQTVEQFIETKTLTKTKTSGKATSPTETNYPLAPNRGKGTAEPGERGFPLMTCKYCILNELGCCKKKNPRKAGVPTYLRQQNLLLRIQTNCQKCEMQLIMEDGKWKM